MIINVSAQILETRARPRDVQARCIVIFFN